MTNRHNTTLYTGVTSRLYGRTQEHKEKVHPGSFTARYNLNKLVWYEFHSRIEDAIAREKQIKSWSRAKKVALIEAMNPEWRDLFEDLEPELT